MPRQFSACYELEYSIVYLFRRFGEKVSQNISLACNQVDVYAKEKTATGQARELSGRTVG